MPVPSAEARRWRRGLSSTLLAATALACTIPLSAQPLHWGERFTLSQRRRAGIAYDANRDRIVLYGGIQSRGSSPC